MPTQRRSFELNRDLPNLEVDLWHLVASVPRGKVTTCGALAEALGASQAARWIGKRLLHHEHDDSSKSCVCHRVVRAGGLLGGYVGSVQEKMRLLRAEGVEVLEGLVDLDRFQVRLPKDTAPLQKLARFQQSMAEQVMLQGIRLSAVRWVGGLDLSYTGDEAVAAYTLCRFTSHGNDSDTSRIEIVRTTLCRARVTFPYISSFLAFRELPGLLQVIEQAEAIGPRADVLLVDGSGVLHPRRCGIASMLGVLLSRPTIGVTKKKLIGSVDVQEMRCGELRDVVLDGRRLGVALRPATGTARPLFISSGHLIRPNVATKLVAQLMCDSANRPLRLPWPLFVADRESRREALCSASRPRG